MKQKQLSEAEALNLYESSNDKGKKILIEKFGKKLFIPEKITDKIKTIDDVIKLANPEKEVLALIKYTGKNRKMIGAKNFILAELIAEVYNQGWEADYTDENQKKWSAWFDGRKGFAFSGSFYGSWSTLTFVGSRLCFKSEELLLHAVTTFPNVYKEILSKKQIK